MPKHLNDLNSKEMKDLLTLVDVNKLGKSSGAKPTKKKAAKKKKK